MNFAATSPDHSRADRVLAVLPARLGATRLPRKPLRLLGGKPLIVRVYERVAALAVADAIVVATDAQDVIDACAAHDVPATLTSASHESGTDRMAEVAKSPDFAGFPILLNVQGDEPFVARDALDGAIRIVRDDIADVGTAAAHAGTDVLDQPDIVKVVTTIDGRALYFSRAAIPFMRDSTDARLLEGMIRRHIGVYAFRREALLRWVSLPVHPLERIERLEQLRALANGLSIGVATVNDAEGGIDTEEDLARANARFDMHAVSR